MNICRKNAIEVTQSEYGELIPKVNEEKCVACGMCQKICPSNNEQVFSGQTRAYAAWSKNEDDVALSSSGGVASVFSRYVIKKGGAVFGAESSDKATKHICISTEDELCKLRGSKYVQSEIGFTYRDAEKQLKDGKLVLFTGTPCQIAGLKAYLGKDYGNLITVDLICHGTPSHTYLKEHLDAKCKSWDGYSFRGKYDFVMVAYLKEQPVFIKNRFRDEYFMAFLNGLSYRESCYECKYARPERVSDITIGDFWGLDRKSLKNPYKGRISLILPNTQKGQEFIKETEALFNIEERKVKEAQNPQQGNLLQPSAKPKDREKFLENYKKMGFDRAVRKTNLWKKNVKIQRRLQIRSFVGKGLRLVKKIGSLKK
ncbi:MAG: Coenzyme F420 hydrogenase/dehydrogenase, beta subunit C-terminal domain [Clostridia bacterium]|nr:Coenzyme F420 hydrogenase/dehydrogenase, beta subunit C-terminal domain [Clostridia bacterium]